MGRVIKLGELKAKPIGISKEARQAAKMLVEAKRAAFYLRQEAREDVIELAIAMARRIVGKTIELDPATLNDMYSDTINSASELKKGEVRIHPTDRELSNIDKLSSHAGFQVVSDPSMERLGCVICVEGAEVDGTVESALQLFKEALKGTHIDGD